MILYLILLNYNRYRLVERKLILDFVFCGFIFIRFKKLCIGFIYFKGFDFKVLYIMCFILFYLLFYCVVMNK